MAFVARMRSRLPACSLGAGCRMPAACLSALRGGAPLAVVFRSCRAVRFPRRRALGSGVMRCRFHRHRSLCARLFLFLRPAVLAVFLRGVLELLDAASQAAHQFGDFPAAEQEQYDQQDKYQLGRAEEQGEDELMSWYVRVVGVCVFRPGFPVVFPETGTALRTNVLRISETPPSGVKKSGVHPKHPARTVFRESVI